MENRDYSLIWKAYFNREHSIFNLLGPLQAEALSCHWAGDFQRSIEKYKTLLNSYKPGSDQLLDLAYADYILVSVKIGVQFPSDLEIKTLGSVDSQLVLLYAKFYWAFWVDHKVAINALKNILLISPFSNCKEFFFTGIFLYFHLKTIAGNSFISYYIAGLIYKIVAARIRRSNTISHFARNVVIASFPYTQFVAGHVAFKNIEDTIAFAEENIVNDPFYHSLILIGGFYGYAYSGNIARTEIFAERFSLLQTQGKLVRYKSITSVMRFLPHALRGYGHLISIDFYKALENHKVQDHDPLINSQFYRACSVILLLLGQNDRANQLIQLARQERKKTLSFGAWERIDSQIQLLSARKTPFDPAKDRLANIEVDFSQPPQLGSILFSLINETPSALKGSRSEFIELMATVISNHLDCKCYKLADQIDLKTTRNPQLLIGGKILEFRDIPENRLQYLKELFSSLTPMLNRFVGIYDELLQSQEFRREAALVELATVTAHNILGSLDALEIDSENISYQSDEQRKRHKRLLARVKTVANELLTKKRQLQISKLSGSEVSAKISRAPELLPSLVDNIVKEKTLSSSLKGIEIVWRPDSTHYSLFCAIDSTEFESALGNIIDNAVDAIELSSARNKTVDVSVRLENGFAKISIADSAGGIPVEIINQVANKGFTTKQNGNGYGLFHAKEQVETWGGDLLVENVDSGACITMKIPLCAQPAWFATLVTLPVQGKVVVFDDDDGIHYTWAERLRPYGFSTEKNNFISCYNRQQLLDVIGELKKSGSVFTLLSDYEILGDSKNGLDLICELDLVGNAYIVSSYYREQFVTNPCEEKGVRIIPKNLARFSRIYLKGAPLDAVLVEDTDLWQSMWSNSASQNGKQILSFHSVSELLTCLSELPKDTPIYVDSKLGQESGEEASLKLHQLGYTNLHLATATAAADYKNRKLKHIRSIVGKAPPWRIGAQV